MYKISYLIAAYNCENVISDTINSAIDATKEVGYNIEIIIIDDFSSDNTLIKILEFKKKYDFIQILNNKKNLGFSESILKTLDYVNGDYIKILHAANIEKKNQILTFLNAIKKNDFVLTEPIDNRGFFRKKLSKICSLILCLITGKYIKYFNSAILCKSNLFKKFYTLDNLYGNFSLSLVIAKLLINNYKFCEVRIAYDHPMKGSKSVTIKNLLAFITVIFKILNIRIKKQN